MNFKISLVRLKLSHTPSHDILSQVDERASKIADIKAQIKLVSSLRI